MEARKNGHSKPPRMSMSVPYLVINLKKKKKLDMGG